MRENHGYKSGAGTNVSDKFSPGTVGPRTEENSVGRNFHAAVIVGYVKLFECERHNESEQGESGEDEPIWFSKLVKNAENIKKVSSEKKNRS